jgi:DNA-binding NarL/FixJ family response regulator
VKHKIYILDDHPVVIEGLKKILESQEDLQVVGTSEDASISGVDIIKKLKQSFPETHVLVYSMHDENVYAERSLRAGAMGYLMKGDPVSRVLLAIRQILGGGFFFSANLLGSIVSGGGPRSSARGEPGRMLSDRQLEIFEMVGRGFDSHEIASKLELSAKTVDAHKANIRQKLGLDSARELLMEAVRWVEK